MTDEYIDPNSGRAPQPGGYAAAVVVNEEPSESEDRDATYDAEQEHSAGPQGDQPAPQNDGETANEAGQTEDDATTEGGAPAEEPPAEEDGDGAGSDEEPEKKDYSELLDQNLGPIQEYMDEHPDEADAIKAAEIDRAGDDARKGVIEYGD